MTQRPDENSPAPQQHDAEADTAARREFVRRYGGLAVAGSAAIAMLLTTSMASAAIARSGGGRGGWGGKAS